jgi:hypothetical protein
LSLKKEGSDNKMRSRAESRSGWRNWRPRVDLVGGIGGRESIWLEELEAENLPGIRTLMTMMTMMELILFVYIILFYYIVKIIYILIYFNIYFS